jgi:hypothetical protein
MIIKIIFIMTRVFKSYLKPEEMVSLYYKENVLNTSLEKLAACHDLSV